MGRNSRGRSRRVADANIDFSYDHSNPELRLLWTFQNRPSIVRSTYYRCQLSTSVIEWGKCNDRSIAKLFMCRPIGPLNHGKFVPSNVLSIFYPSCRHNQYSLFQQLADHKTCNHMFKHLIITSRMILTDFASVL